MTRAITHQQKGGGTGDGAALTAAHDAPRPRVSGYLRGIVVNYLKKEGETVSYAVGGLYVNGELSSWEEVLEYANSLRVCEGRAPLTGF